MVHVPNSWMIGKVTITQIVEREERGVDPRLTLAALEPAEVREIDWLVPHYADGDGMLAFSIHAYVIESEGRRIVVDTCVGNNKTRAYENWHKLQGPFLDHMAQAGFPADSIDTVLCTHLHVDHVGWNTRWDGDHWVPTFPNARYLFGRVEWGHWHQEAQQAVDGEAAFLLNVVEVMADSVQPIVDAGLHDLVESDHHITGEVELIPTPGHTPGHVSVRIRSQGHEAIITGDVLHHPVQMAVPDHANVLDTDTDAARVTRRAFLGEQADREVLVLGTHFPQPSGGHVLSEGDVWRFRPVLKGGECQ